MQSHYLIMNKMNRKNLVIIILIISNLGIAQKTTQLDEVVINNKIDFNKLIKKIKKQLVKNCDTISYKYNYTQKSNKNNDSILSLNEIDLIGIKSYSNNFKKKIIRKNKSNWIDSNNLIFKNYNTEESPVNWISNFPIRKNLNTINLKFFKNYKDYTYEYSVTDSIVNVKFNSDKGYKGSFSYKKDSYNLTSIEYENNVPYNFSNISSHNLKSINDYESNWNYETEKVNIHFTENKNKIKLQSILIEERINDMEFKRFDKKGKILFEEKNNYFTIINLKIVNNEK